MVGGDPDLITNRDLTMKERDRIDEAYRIRSNISNLLIYSSIAVSIISLIVLSKGKVQPRIIVKVALYVSAFIAVFLILINGIHFIPEPPIR